MQNKDFSKQKVGQQHFLVAMHVKLRAFVKMGLLASKEPINFQKWVFYPTNFWANLIAVCCLNTKIA